MSWHPVRWTPLTCIATENIHTCGFIYSVTVSNYKNYFYEFCDSTSFFSKVHNLDPATTKLMRLDGGEVCSMLHTTYKSALFFHLPVIWYFRFWSLLLYYLCHIDQYHRVTPYKGMSAYTGCPSTATEKLNHYSHIIAIISEILN